MKPVVKRTISALLSAGAVVAALLAVNRLCDHQLAFDIVSSALIVLIALAQLEFSQMLSGKAAIMTKLGLLMGVAWMVSLCHYFAPWAIFAKITLLVSFILTLLWPFLARKPRPFAAQGLTWLGFLYLPVMLSFLLAVLHDHGVMMFFYVIAIVKISDMGGFALGVSCGRHKLCPTISPNKSWEGLLGSVLAATIISCAFIPVTQFTYEKAVLFGVLAALVGTAGDLVESKFKRWAGVKDSSTFMPAGMGGFLDMFDSLVFVPAVLIAFL